MKSLKPQAELNAMKPNNSHRSPQVKSSTAWSDMRFMPDINSHKMLGNEKMLPNYKTDVIHGRTFEDLTAAVSIISDFSDIKSSSFTKPE